MLMAMKMLAKADQPMASVMLPHDPAHAERARHWCSVHLVRYERVAAPSDCDYAVARDPSHAAAYSNRNSIWLSANEPARALRNFNEAIAWSPGSTSTAASHAVGSASVIVHLLTTPRLFE